MNRGCLRLLLVLALIGIGGSVISFQGAFKTTPNNQGDFVGTWVPAGRGSDFRQVTVKKVGSKLTVLVTSLSTGDDYQWHKADLTLFAKSVSGGGFQKGMARWTDDGVVRSAIFTPTKTGLSLEIFTDFGDGDTLGRSNYVKVENFKRKRP